MTYKMIYLARRAANVSREDWPRTWRSHAVFASQFPAIGGSIDYMRYCNRIDTPMLEGKAVDLPGLSTAHDGVAMVSSPGLAGLNGSVISPEDRVRIDADELRVFDMLTPNFSYYGTEAILRDGKPGEAALYRFLARKPGITHEEFEARMRSEHADIAREAGGKLGTITRYVHNHPVHDPLPLFPFDGIVESWFVSAEDAVRALTYGSLAAIETDLAEFCDTDRTTTMLTGVIHRWPKD